MTAALAYKGYRTIHGHVTKKTGDDIRVMYEERRNAMGNDLMRMRQIRDVMQDDMWLPLPELRRDEKPAVANLAHQGMSQLARRISSVSSTHYFPALDPGSKASVERADKRHKIMSSWHHENHLRRHMGKRARQFLAFACAPVVIKPGQDGLPHWHLRDPLETFPSETRFDSLVPIDVIFASTHTFRWLLQHYPDEAMLINKPAYWDPHDPDWDLKFTLLEYINEDECTHVLCADPGSEGDVYRDQRYDNILLSSYPNLARRTLAVVPGSVNLDDQKGHFDNIIGMYQAQAALMALSIIAQRRAVWPREWAESNPNDTVDVVVVPDPYSGTPGQINGGKIVQQKIDPSIQALELQDRLEYAQRMTAALPSEFGGMSPTNVRTGRRGAQVMGQTVDFTISEAQDVFAESQYEENCTAIEIDKGYFNSRKKYHIVTRGFSGTIDYTPSEIWETSKHIVDYPMAGVDLQNLPIEGGQRIMMQTLSRRRFMDMDPLIPDAEEEEQRIFMEGLATAFVSSVQQMAAMPEGPYQPADIGRMMELASEGMSPWEVVAKVQKEAQDRQAQEVPQGDPLAQPGMSMPGQGMEQPTPPVDDTSLGGMTNLLGQLGQVQQAQTHRR